jgi:hypothetical protein
MTTAETCAPAQWKVSRIIMSECCVRRAKAPPYRWQTLPNYVHELFR